MYSNNLWINFGTCCVILATVIGLLGGLNGFIFEPPTRAIATTNICFHEKAEQMIADKGEEDEKKKERETVKYILKHYVNVRGECVKKFEDARLWCKSFYVDDEERSTIDLESIEEIKVDPITRDLKHAFDIDMIYVNVEKGDYGAFMFYKM